MPQPNMPEVLSVRRAAHLALAGGDAARCLALCSLLLGVGEQASETQLLACHALVALGRVDGARARLDAWRGWIEASRAHLSPETLGAVRQQVAELESAFTIHGRRDEWMAGRPILSRHAGGAK